MLVVPFLIGLIFVSEKIWFGFTLGAVFIGFFLAVSTTVFAGLLESSKEWLICKTNFKVVNVLE